MSLADKIHRLKTATQRKSDSDVCEVNVGDLNDVLEEFRVVLTRYNTFMDATKGAPVGQIWNVLAGEASSALDTMKDIFKGAKAKIQAQIHDNIVIANALESAAHLARQTGSPEAAEELMAQARAARDSVSASVAQAQKLKESEAKMGEKL